MTVRAATRTRKVRTTEYRCVVCGAWWAPKRPALTCSTRCRVQLTRLRSRGEQPPHALRER